MNHLFLDEQIDIGMNLGEMAMNRSSMYQLLSRVIQFPTFSLSNELLNGEFYSKIENSVQWINVSSGVFNEALIQLIVLAENKKNVSPKEMLEKMKEEYTHLFLNEETSSVSLYETMYLKNTDEQKSFNVDSLDNVYSVEEDFFRTDPVKYSDHLVNELCFLGYLCNQEGEAWKCGKITDAHQWRNKQWEFTMNHLGKWGEDFFANLEKSTNLEVYKTIASLGRTFLKLERGY